MTPITLDDLRAGLALPGFDGVAAQRHMTPLARTMARPPEMGGRPKLGAVLALFYDAGDALALVLTKRPDYDGVHGGQVSFPGGRHEPPETLERTALRETHEEIGVEPERIALLGAMTPLYILPSDYEVHPFVGYHVGGRPMFVPDAREVATVLEAPLELLLDPANRHEEEWELRGMRMRVPFFLVGEHKVWGATAMMLSELVERLAYGRRQRSETA